MNCYYSWMLQGCVRQRISRILLDTCHIAEDLLKAAIPVSVLSRSDHEVLQCCIQRFSMSCFSQVVFVKKLQDFSCLHYQQFHCEKKHDIYFSDEKIYAQYRYCSASVIFKLSHNYSQ